MEALPPRAKPRHLRPLGDGGPLMRRTLLQLLLPVRRKRRGVHPALEAAARWQELERAAARWRIYEQGHADDRRRP